jgi:hypothetical protein
MPSSTVTHYGSFGPNTETDLETVFLIKESGAGTQTVGNATQFSSTLGVTGAVTLSSTLAVTGAITATGGVAGALSATGALKGTGLTEIPGTLLSGTQDALPLIGFVLVTSTQVDAMTLALPAAGTNDGQILTVVDTGGHAHTITTGTGGFISGSTQAHRTGTFNGNAGAQITLQAYNGLWYVMGNTSGSAGVAVALT